MPGPDPGIRNAERAAGHRSTVAGDADTQAADR
jgi:hypothetical protein